MMAGSRARGASREVGGGVGGDMGWHFRRIILEAVFFFFLVLFFT